MIIDSSYFTKGIRHIQNCTVHADKDGATMASVKPEAIAANAMIEGYIEQYQHRFMVSVFGREVADALEAYAEQGEEVISDYDAVLKNISDALADWVMYWFLRGASQQATSLGVTVFDNANKVANPASRQAEVWNDMVDELRAFSEWAVNGTNVNVSIEQDMLTKITAVWL